MKKISLFLIFVLSCALLSACGRSDKVNGNNIRTAYRSVKVLKERLPVEKRIEFEVSFWTIRDAQKSDSGFLDAVDGKTPVEIIERGRDIYQQRKNAGFKGYEQYSSWEDMISKFGQERSQQGSIKTEDARDKANDVLYNLKR
jgi:major membrane immunogen (membrane-anchored lipoprotein)